LLRISSSTTSPMSRVMCLRTLRGSSSTTLPMSCVRVPRHVPRLVARLNIDYFNYAARLGARHVARLVVDYFAHAARPGASARRAAHRRLLLPHRSFECLSSSSTTSPTPRFWVPWHVAWLVVQLVIDYFAYAVPRLVARLVVDYFAYVVPSGASAPRAARRRPRAVSPLDFSSVGCTGSSRAPGHSISRLSYSSLGCTGSTTYVVHPDVLSSPFDFSSVARTGSRRAPGHSVSRLGYSPLGCTDSTAPMLGIRTRRLAARLLVGRLHWLSPCARSLRLAARILVARLHWFNCLCRASGCAVFAARLLVGQSHWFSPFARSLHLAARLLTAQLHRLYCTYVVHLDASSSLLDNSTPVT
jgi:hypothetical protein